MAIMTGVQSAQVLGPSTQKQVDKSRAAVDGEDLGDSRSRAAEANGTAGATASAAGSDRGWESDGGTEPTETNNGLDVIR
jgi:cell division protein FtsZ